MFTSLKIAGFSGLMAAGLVFALASPGPSAAVQSAKLFHDRIGDGGFVIAAPAGLQTSTNDTAQSARQRSNRSAKADRIKDGALREPVPVDMLEPLASSALLVMTEAPSGTTLR